MPAGYDLIGQHFDRLEVIGLGPKKGDKRTWACRCDCGRASVAFTNDLISGKHRSCGCLQLERVTKHGATKFGAPRVKPEYNSWSTMKDRCYNPNATHFDRYGGRGITVCDRWLRSFENFLTDMGPRPTVKHTLDRIDNDGPYAPENCRWATRGEQAQNRTWNPDSAWNGPRDGAGRFKPEH